MLQITRKGMMIRSVMRYFISSNSPSGGVKLIELQTARDFCD